MKKYISFFYKGSWIGAVMILIMGVALSGCRYDSSNKGVSKAKRATVRIYNPGELGQSTVDPQVIGVLQKYGWAIPVCVWPSRTTDSAYSFTPGSSTININETGEYEISYNIPFNQTGNNTDKGIGSNLILNNAITVDNATSAGWSSKNNAAGSISLPTVNITLTAGDTLDLVGFRTASSGNATTSPNGSILIKKKDKLQ